MRGRSRPARVGGSVLPHALNRLLQRSSTLIGISMRNEASAARRRSPSLRRSGTARVARRSTSGRFPYGMACCRRVTKTTDPYSPRARANARAKPVEQGRDQRRQQHSPKRLPARRAQRRAAASSASTSKLSSTGWTVRTTNGSPMNTSTNTTASARVRRRETPTARASGPANRFRRTGLRTPARPRPSAGRTAGRRASRKTA